ncbi:hypothetical protein GEMRC1_004139 [Eukaryota sp. GEM-RC1]
MEDSIARIIMEIPNERPLFPDEQAILHDLLTEADEAAEIRGGSLIYLSVQTLEKILEEGVNVLFLGQIRNIVVETDFFNDVLRFLGSSIAIAGCAMYEYPVLDILVMGTAVRQKKGDYETIIIERELERTPAAVLSLPRFSTPKYTIVREEVFDRDFCSKWIPLFDRKEVKNHILIECSSAIDYLNTIVKLIETKTIRILMAKHQESRDAVRTHFVGEMAQLHLTHEIASRALIDDKTMFPANPMVIALSVAEKCDMPILDACIQLIIDLLPGEYPGPLRLLCSSKESLLLAYVAEMFSLQDDKVTRSLLYLFFLPTMS